MFYSKQENRRKGWYRVLRISKRQMVALCVLLGLLAAAVLAVAVCYHLRARDYNTAEVVRAGGASVLFDSSGKPVLKWTAVKDATMYSIYRATSQSGTYSWLAYAYTNTYTDTSAKSGTTYYYKLFAGSKDASGYGSSYSAIVSAK